MRISVKLSAGKPVCWQVSIPVTFCTGLSITDLPEIPSPLSVPQSSHKTRSRHCEGDLCVSLGNGGWGNPSFIFFLMEQPMNTASHFSPITAAVITDNQRINHTARLFGMHFPMTLEPFIFFMADTLCEDYQGGLWTFYALSNDGFYMAPTEPERFTVSCENGYTGTLSAEAFGIVCCLYAYSHLSFGKNEFALVCAEHYHRLREWMYEHPESGSILLAID